MQTGKKGLPRWIRRVVGGVLALVTVAGGVLVAGVALADRKMHRQVAVAVADVPLRTDAQSVARGAYLFASRGCADCHGADGAGKVFIDDPGGLLVRGANLTPGPASAVAHYRSVDWVRTIRHGVKPNGEPALVMPSEDYNRFTDDDLASLVAFIRQLPPQPGAPAQVRMPAIVKLLYAAGVVPDAAERIDHGRPSQQPVAEAVTHEHGAYVANMCIGCHGANLSGGKIPGAPPDWPAAANLTPGDGSAMARYANAEQFRAMLTSGRRPDGSPVSPVMPFTSLQAMNQVDVDALYLYLAGLPPQVAGKR